MIPIMLSSFRILGKFIKKLVAKKGMAQAILDYAEFAASLTKSEKDDEVVAKLKASLGKAESEAKKVVKKAKAVKEVLKK
tara:strand:- start:437 stop:676 length:240 start_codon:yes stop_codon:yes gene_type:complete